MSWSVGWLAGWLAALEQSSRRRRRLLGKGPTCRMGAVGWRETVGNSAAPRAGWSRPCRTIQLTEPRSGPRLTRAERQQRCTAVVPMSRYIFKAKQSCGLHADVLPACLPAQTATAAAATMMGFRERTMRAPMRNCYDTVAGATGSLSLSICNKQISDRVRPTI